MTLDPETTDPRTVDPESADIDPGEIDPAEPCLFATDAADHDRRLDVVVTEATRRLDVTLSRTRVKSLIEDGYLTLDGEVVRDGNHKLKAGQSISLAIPSAVDPEPKGEDLPLVIVYEDDHLIVIDKPAGLVVHPAPGHPTGTLVNALIGHCGASLSGIGGVKRPGIVHRLDKDTSGLLVVAKTDAAHRGFSKLFADHGRTLSLKRSYLAFVWGAPERLFGSVDAPLGRHPTDRQRMAVVSEAKGREAITHWRLEENFGRLDESLGSLEDEAGRSRVSGPGSKTPVASLLACVLETGRTHQIRVHMAHIGHPVLGDPLYAKGFRSKMKLLSAPAQDHLEGLGRQALHASILGFEHPVTREVLEFESPLPPELERLRRLLRGGRV